MTGSVHDLVVLAGGAGRRMGGADKAEVVVAGLRLLDRVLAAAPGAGRRVVVGPVRPTQRAVTWCREHPPGGGPVAGLAAAVPRVAAPYAVVLAVDLPLVEPAVVTRLLAAAAGRDGAVGVDPSGRDQPLLAAYDVAALRTALVDVGPVAGAPMRSVLAGLNLARVDVGTAALDCDTWADVTKAEAAILSRRNAMTELDRWVQRLQEELGVEEDDVVVDIGAILDLARVAAHEVDRPAAPLTTFLVGYAAGRASGAGNPITIEVLAARAAALAESWSPPR